MATLREVQGLVNEAQAEIRKHNRQRVETVLWPEIKRKLSDCTDLDRPHRVNMSRLIYQRLNEELLNTTPGPINLTQLKGDLETGRIQVPAPLEGGWLVW